MGLSKTILATICLTCMACNSGVKQAKLRVNIEKSYATTSDAHALYFLNNGRINEAIQALQLAKKQNPYLYHTGTLQRLGLGLLDHGLHCRDTKDVLLALYGIGISGNEEAVALAKEAITCSIPEIQFAAVQLLANCNTDEATLLLEQALKSEYFLIRLEAAYHLAVKKVPTAYAHLEALFAQIPAEYRSYFPELFAIDGSSYSKQMLKKLLYDSDLEVRLATINAITATNQKEFLGDIRKIMNDPSPMIQEAIFVACAMFHDNSIEPLLVQAINENRHTALSAAYALTLLGDIDHTGRNYIVYAAQNDNLFALHLLGKIAPTDPILHTKMKNPDLQVHLNASLALLERKDPHMVLALATLFVQRHNDLAFQMIQSPGKTLFYCKAIPSAEENLKKTPFLFEVSLRLQEEWLIKCAELPEEEFLEVAELIFSYEQHELIPILVRLLENVRSEKAIELIKHQSERIGNPFIRAYCNLALYRIGERGTIETKVLEWVKQNATQNLLETRPLLPWQLRNEKSRYSFTFAERSRLLVESFEALAMSHQNDAVDALLQAIKDGNPHNRYLLAGLLVRAAS